jgi:hypothetical protein
MNVWKLLSFSVCWGVLSQSAKAQTIEQGQFWAGLMTQTRIGKKSLWWNDFHFVPQGFGVIRTGYTHEIGQSRVTVGLAYLALPDAAKNLTRSEWRPWAQWFWIKKINSNHQCQFRLRYEARFREKLQNSAVIKDEYDFNHRFRIQAVWRYNLADLGKKDKLFVAIGGEILLNQGGQTYWLDQHRRNITLGLARKGFIFQTGYMNRQNLRNNGTVSQINHTWINWLILEF